MAPRSHRGSLSTWFPLGGRLDGSLIARFELFICLPQIIWSDNPFELHRSSRSVWLLSREPFSENKSPTGTLACESYDASVFPFIAVLIAHNQPENKRMRSTYMETMRQIKRLGGVSSRSAAELVGVALLIKQLSSYLDCSLLVRRLPGEEASDSDPSSEGEGLIHCVTVPADPSCPRTQHSRGGSVLLILLLVEGTLQPTLPSSSAAAPPPPTEAQAVVAAAAAAAPHETRRLYQYINTRLFHPKTRSYQGFHGLMSSADCLGGRPPAHPIVVPRDPRVLKAGIGSILWPSEEKKQQELRFLPFSVRRREHNLQKADTLECAPLKHCSFSPTG